MFIVKKDTRDVKTEKVYSYYKLVESEKTANSVKQRLILYLGKLSLKKEELAILAHLIEMRIHGKREIARFPKLEKLADKFYLKYRAKQEKEAVRRKEQASAFYAEIDLNSTEQTQYRSIGCETVCEHFWQLLNFSEILKQCGFSRKEIDLAKVIIFGRLISPGSELQTIRWFFHQSSLLEILKTNLSDTGKDTFYCISDLLLANKDKIESMLRRNTKQLFPYSDTIYLYDLTNTYLESSKPNSELCQRGKSKEKRSDCPLVTLALVVDQHGFPIYSRIYQGNKSEPKTLKDILNSLYHSTDDYLLYLEKPAIVMDRGIATKENVSYLKQEGYSYFIIERREATKQYKAEFSDICTTGITHDTRSKQTVYLKTIDIEEGTRVLVYSPMKDKKESGIIGKQEQRYIDDVNKLITSNQNGYIKDFAKINQRIGRIKERYGAVAELYDIKLVTNKQKKDHVSFVQITRKVNPKIIKKKELAGCYVIETNRKDLKAEDIWEFYIMLHEVESSFRSMKSELGTRPIYHRLDSRVESHLFISVLAYFIVKSITFSLNYKKDYRISWKRLRQTLSNHMRGTTIQKTKTGKTYYIRVTGKPETEVQEIYDILGIKVKANRKIQNKPFHL